MRSVQSQAKKSVTGLTNLSSELGGTRLDLLREAVPKVARIAVLYNPTNPPGVLEMKEVLPYDVGRESTERIFGARERFPN